MALPPVDIEVDLFYDDDWHDVTNYVYMRDPLTISRGTPNESNTADASACTLTFNNRDGRFSPRNPLSPLYGKIGRNTPLRVIAAVRTPNDHGLFTRNNSNSYATTPDAAALDIVGDIDLRAELRPIDTIGTQCIIGKGTVSGITGTQLSYQLLTGSTNGVPHVTLRWSTDGTTTQFVDHDMPEILYGRRIAIRATMDVDNGAGAKVISFYTSSDRTLGGTWNLHGSAHTVAGTTSIFSGTAALDVGRNGVNDAYYGTIYGVRVLNGIAGAAAANPDFDTQTIGATTFADAAGRTWTLGANANIGYTEFPRIVGEVSSWPKTWDTSGTDVWVPVQVAGVSRRLGQGQPPALTGIKTFAIDSKYDQCWPCDTANGLPRPGRAGAFQSPLTLNHCTADVHFGQGEMASGLPAGMLIDKTNLVTGNVYPASGYISDFIGSGPGGTYNAAGFVFRGDALGSFAFYLQAAGTLFPGGYVALFDAVAATLTLYRINYDPDVGYSLTLIGASAGQGFFTDGAVHSFLWTIVDVGATLTHTAYIDGASVATGSDSTSSPQGVTQFQFTYDPTTVASASSIAVSYLTFWSPLNATAAPGPVAWAQAADGYIGETAGRRVERLCSENGVPFYNYGNLDSTARMGAQGSATLLSLLQDAATTDAGLLFDDFEQPGLIYATRSKLYDQTPGVVLNYAANVFADAPNPTDDDQNLHNDVTVTNTSGGSAEAILASGPLSVLAPPNGVNTYPTSYGLNLENDGPLPDHASWRLHLGTIDEDRYPALSLNMLNARIFNDTDLANDILAMDVTFGLTIKNPPAWLPPDDVSQLMLGYTETLTQFGWSIAANCVPASPYDVAHYGASQGDAAGDRYDAENAWLDVGVNSSATSLAIVSGLATALWTTDGAAFPFDIVMGGERMTVTGVTGSDIAFVGVGTSATGNNASVTPGLPAGVAVGDVVLIFASIRNSGAGTVNTPAGWTTLVNDMGNAKIVGRVYDGVWTMPAVTFAGGVLNADTIVQSCAFRGVRLAAIGASSLNGSAQDIAESGVNVVGALTEDVVTLYAAWKQDDFTTAVTSSALLGSSVIEIGEAVATAGDDAGQVWNYAIRGIDPASDLTVSVFLPAITWTITGGAAAISRATMQMIRRAPQTFTVTRSVNGVVKAHSAGEKVRLFKTPRYGL